MPAYNAELTLEATVAGLPPGCCDEILVGDDCSRDKTIAVAERLGRGATVGTIIVDSGLRYLSTDVFKRGD